MFLLLVNIINILVVASVIFIYINIQYTCLCVWNVDCWKSKRLFVFSSIYSSHPSFLPRFIIYSKTLYIFGKNCMMCYVDTDFGSFHFISVYFILFFMFCVRVFVLHYANLNIFYIHFFWFILVYKRPWTFIWNIQHLTRRIIYTDIVEIIWVEIIRFLSIMSKSKRYNAIYNWC